MSNENNNQFNNEARENHDGQFGHGQKRPYNRPKNYKYKPQHRNSYGRKPMQDRKAPADKEKNGIQVPFKAAIKNSSRRPKKPTSKLKIIPLGGLEQIGMNITAFEYEDSIVVVDCGLAFPEDDMLGIDLVIPDVTYLKENISKVKGFVITHGHEDHIGALPYVLKDVNVPVYSTKLTIALIANKLKEHNMTNTTKLKEVRHGQVINLGDFSIEFIKTNHSIQDASALAIYSPAGIVAKGKHIYWMHTIPFWSDAVRQELCFSEKAQIVGCELAETCEPDFDPENPFEAMAERMVYHSLNGSALRRIEAGIRHAKQAGADGAVWFGHWGCKHTLGAAQLAKKKFEEAGLPLLILDGDGCDRSHGGEGQTSTRLGAFLEMLGGAENE